MADTLRVGFLCDSLELQRWQAECIRRVLAVPGVEPVLVVTHPVIAHAKMPWTQRILNHPWRIALYMWYRHKRFHPVSYVREDMSAALAGVPRMECTPLSDGSGQRFEGDDLAAIAAHRPDVLLRFGFGILKGDILSLPEHGVWSYHHGDEEKYRGQPPVFWEMERGETVVGAVLQRLTERLDAGFILQKGWFPVTRSSLSATLDSVLLGSAGWAAQVCHDLLNGRPGSAVGVESNTTAPVRKYPDNLTFLQFLWRQNQNKLGQLDDRRSIEEWNIGVLYQPIEALLAAKPNLNARWLPSPSLGQSRACPYGYLVDGHLNVIYEKRDEMDRTTEISRLRPKRDNVLKRSRTLIPAEQRHSGSCVLTRPEGIFIVLCDHRERRVELHRMSASNEGTERVCTLINEELRSPTLFEHGGRWWLMGTQVPSENAALHAFFADRMEGPYERHVLSPLKVDVRSARPGGAPFVHEGQLYRPAQDHGSEQGVRIAVMRVLQLDPQSFREELVKTIGPLRGSAWSQGMATLTSIDGYTLVDGMRRVNRPAPADRQRRRSRSSGGTTTPRKSTDISDDEDDD
jgi:hypothetical protein